MARSSGGLKVGELVEWGKALYDTNRRRPHAATASQRARTSALSSAVAASIVAPRYAKAHVGLNAVHSSPAMADAATFPRLCTPASSPNADPRISDGVPTATAACSAVSAHPIPMPAATNGCR